MGVRMNISQKNFQQKRREQSAIECLAVLNGNETIEILEEQE